MGVITLALIANGNLAAGADPPLWVIASRGGGDRRSAPTAAAGGSSRRPAPGSSRWTPRRASRSQGAGAAVILASTHFGFPLSTTHVINGGVMGAGAAKRVSAVRWGVAGNIVVAWLLTLPAAAAIGAARLRRDADLRHRRPGPGPGHPGRRSR